MSSQQKTDPNFSDDWDDEDSEYAAMRREREGAELLEVGGPEPAHAHSPLTPPPVNAAALSEPQTRWPIARKDERDHFPAALTRCALFRVGPIRGADFADFEPLPAYGAWRGRLKFKGPRLSIRDKEVWEEAVRFAKAHGFGAEPVRIPLGALSSGLGRGDGSEAIDRARDSLERLARAELEFSPKEGKAVRAKLLERTVLQDAGRVDIHFDPNLSRLFELDSRFEMKPGRHAGKPQLFAWLLDFFSINDPYPEGFPISELRELCGFEAEPERFGSQLREALDRLEKDRTDIVASWKRLNGDRFKPGKRVSVTPGFEKAKFKPGEETFARKPRPSKAKGKNGADRQIEKSADAKSV